MSWGIPFLAVQIFVSRGLGNLTVLESGLGQLQLQVTQHRFVDQVDFDHTALEFTGEDRVTAICRKITMADATTLGRFNRVLQFQGLGVAEIKTVLASATTMVDCPSGVKYTL